MEPILPIGKNNPEFPAVVPVQRRLLGEDERVRARDQRRRRRPQQPQQPQRPDPGDGHIDVVA